MKRLILIKHAAPAIDPGVTAERWALSDAGRASALALAEVLRPLAPTRAIHSREPKAAGTAEILASALAIPSQEHADLHEHDRTNVPHLRGSEFKASVAMFFSHPDRLTLGLETADQARARFASALAAATSAFPDDTLAIVTHGTVLALHLAPLLGERPFPLWQRMGLPSYAVIEDGRVTRLVDRL